MPIEVVEDVTKDPSAVLWYGWDLRALGWMAPDDTVASTVWTIAQESGSEETPALVKTAQAIIEDATRTVLRLTVGTDGLDYLVRGVWTTTGGDVDARTFRVMCRAR